MTDGDLRNLHILLSLFNPFSASIAKALFSVEVLVMFSFFLVSGNSEGFSAIWICMLPSLGMFFFGRFRGSALCAVMRLVRDQLTGVLNRQGMYAVLEKDAGTCICTKDLLMKAAAQSRLRELIHLAHNLHVEVVCEGIETKQQEDTVIHNDCDYIQGYLYSYVFPVEEARKYYLSTLSETDTEN